MDVLTFGCADLYVGKNDSPAHKDSGGQVCTQHVTLHNYGGKWIESHSAELYFDASAHGKNAAFKLS